ncbi:hypothetical protein E1180_10620 [Roseibium denhamense]|uniref:hypothetical protein n=1 Tax=Roseibium denhamense TaxID=76305 RepID=UPI0012BCCEE2|nr:hypothetical protein [Roseibium denhamense]MTI05965.1 hypothetical protein [Roseibium denhamense]
MFFIVPDVLLSCLALKSWRRALGGCLAAAIGAVCGGALIWLWMSASSEMAYAVLLEVPGISAATVQRVQELLETGVFPGMLAGAFSGVPYKIFAAETALQSVPLWQLLVLTPFGRLPRFLAITVLAGAISRLIGARLSLRSKLLITLMLWTLFYCGYFWLVGW